MTVRGNLANGGFTLVELLVAVALGGVVTASVCRLLQDNQRFYRSQSEVLDVQQGLRAVANVLASEIRELDARDGDLLGVGRDSVTIRATRSVGVVCAPPDPDAGSVILADALTFGSREVDPARDRVLLFADGDDATVEDDVWLDFGITGISGGARCANGLPGISLRLNGPIRRLTGVTSGSPLRTYERTTYRLYRDDEGISWLGERHVVAGSWSPLSPVAGPLRRTDGLAFACRDSAGTPVTGAGVVARVDVVLRGESMGTIWVPGRRATGRRFQDSLAVQIALRNN